MTAQCSEAFAATTRLGLFGTYPGGWFRCIRHDGHSGGHTFRDASGDVFKIGGWFG